MPLDRPISAPVIVGRERELSAIAALLESGAGTLLISGEAGIGKSRLVREAAADAAARGFRVLQGACFDRDQSLPYAPFLDLVRSFAAAHPDEARRRLPAVMPALLTLLPEASDRPLVPLPTLDPERERRRLFHEVSTFLAGLAAEGPLLVIVEDTHWSDETSLELLLDLARSAAAAPLALLITYRGDDGSAALSHFLAGLDRARAASELRLQPLTPAEIERQVRAMLDLPRPAGAFFVRSLHGLTGGNPFFVEEVLRALIAEGDVFPSADGWQRKPLDQLRVPRTVQDAVQRRGALLSRLAREMLTLAAVAGQRVDFALLQALSHCDEATLTAALKELIAAQLMVELSADRFAFRHALTRQAIYAGLLARERRAWHARVAAAMAESPAGAVAIEDLAYHTFEAEAWEEARALAKAAGDRARALYALQPAIEHYSRSLAAAECLGAAPDAATLHARGQAFDAIGDFDAARADYEAAATAAERAGDSATLLAALLALGLLWSSRDYDQARTWFLRATALARSMGDAAALGHTLNRLGNWYANQEEPDAALHCHDEARSIFIRMEDRRGLAETLDLLAMANALGGDALAAEQAATRAVALFEALDDRQGLAGALPLTALCSALFEGETVVGGSSIAAAMTVAERALILSREIDWRSGEVFSLAMLGAMRAAAGDFGEALTLLQASIAIAEEIDHRQWQIQARWGLARLLGTMLAPALERAELETMLALSRQIHSPVWTNMATAALAAVLIREGQLPPAAELLVDILTPDTPRRTLGQRLLWAARADLALASDDPGEALAIVDQLYAHARHLRSEADVPRLALIKAAALAALGEAGRAAALLRAAQATARDQGALPALWSLLDALAGVLRAQGSDAEAERERLAARTIAAQLATTIPAGELRDGYRRATGLADACVDGAVADQARVGALTPREWQVAQGIAAGDSNRAIAEALFVSERTIETHVANIRRKLEVASRAGIAAWVTRQATTRDT
jgi:DNA-binding CsgD family transcriptional regulator/tetratricopeptide (TPR) repeat protein